MFCTFLRRKCGTWDLRARRAEVRWPKSLAKRSLCGSRGEGGVRGGSGQRPARRQSAAS